MNRPFAALLVDRDHHTRELYRACFMSAGAKVDDTGDGRDALVKALSTHYDVLITETALDGIRGDELCELLRLDPATRHMALVVVTTETESPSMERTRLIADAVLFKPCPPDTVLGEVRKLIEGARRVRREPAARPQHDSQHDSRLPKTARAARADLADHPPPQVLCPECYERLVHKRTHYSAVISSEPADRWDYYECPRRCGTFQYRERSRKVRKVS